MLLLLTLLTVLLPLLPLPQRLPAPHQCQLQAQLTLSGPGWLKGAAASSSTPASCLLERRCDRLPVDKST